MIALLLTSAGAYELLDNDWSWQQHPLEHPLYLNVASFTTEEFDDPQALLTAWEEGVEEWNGVGNLQLVSGGDTDEDSWDSPGVFVAGFTLDEGPGAAIASAAGHGYQGVLYDCSIVFYDRNGWGENYWTFEEDGIGLDLGEVATHEVGHCLGFDHSDDINAVMRPSYRGWRGLHADDEAAVLAVYPSCVDGDGDGVTDCDRDCDDADATLHPGAPELCDGIDNDCDGLVDEVAAEWLTFGDTSRTVSVRDQTSWLSMYTVDRPTTLRSFRQSVEMLEDSRVVFSVIDTSTGEGIRVTEDRIATSGWLESPTLDFPLVPGPTYAIGVGVYKDARYHWQALGSATIDGVEQLGRYWASAVPGAIGSAPHTVTETPYQQLLIGAGDLDGDGTTAQCGDCDDRDPMYIATCTDPDPDPDPEPDPEPDPGPEGGGSGCGSFQAISLLGGTLPMGLVVARRRW